MPDQAVVIGIDAYPGMYDLHGPCNDSLAFRDWLVDPEGGGLSGEDDVALLRTSDFSWPADIQDAHPILDELQTLFRPLVARAAESEHVDGRLFIYVAGHGFAD